MLVEIHNRNHVDKMVYQCIVESETNNRPERQWKMVMAEAGKSGWSFGPIQFDISVSPTGRKILEEIGVSREDVQELATDIWSKRHENRFLIENIVEHINAMLKKRMYRFSIARQSYEYISKAVSRLGMLKDTEHLKLNMPTMLMLIDYHNQFHISRNGRCHEWLKRQEAVGVNNFMMFKYDLPWAQKIEGVDDIKRRFECIMDYCITNCIF